MLYRYTFFLIKRVSRKILTNKIKHNEKPIYLHALFCIDNYSCYSCFLVNYDYICKIMKKLKTAILIHVLWSIFLFLSIAFIKQNINPTYWNESARLSYVFFGPIIGCMIYFIFCTD